MVSWHRVGAAAALVVALGAGSVVWAQGVPAGWIRAGSKPADYEMTVDPNGGRTGAAAVIRAATAASASDFGTLMQQFGADQYRGKRLRLSGYVKSSGITNWSGLWMRVDDGTNKPLAFDNMQGRPIKGTTDWRRYEIVLDVPTAATNIAFGILLSGPGAAWLDDLQFEVVSASVPTTDMMNAAGATGPGPVNLNFDR